MIIRFLMIMFFTFFGFTVSSDPFTNEIGITKKEPEIIEEAQPEEVVEEITEDLFEDEVSDEIASTEQDVEIIETPEGVEEETVSNQEIVTVLNIDPIVGSPLSSYLLKGTALSKESKEIKKREFKRSRVKKVDQAKIPTTHTVQENETIEKIAFRYGFPLREIEIANAIYPGSRELVVGDKIVIPNRFHVVKEGQDLNMIAETYNIEAVQLASYNDLTDENVLLIGDKLLLPFFIHVTNSNETISEIAKRYEREVPELMEFNQFENSTLILNENQLVKIPIYANNKIDYENLDKKSINDFEIDRNNLAIVQIGSGQYLVREGDRIGNMDGIIVSIESTKMVVLEQNIEFEFFINTPITRQVMVQLPQSVNENINTDNIDTNSEDPLNENNNETSETVTNVEELFN